MRETSKPHQDIPRVQKPGSRPSPAALGETSVRALWVVAERVNKYVLGGQICKWFLMLERHYVGRTIA